MYDIKLSNGEDITEEFEVKNMSKLKFKDFVEEFFIKIYNEKEMCSLSDKEEYKEQIYQNSSFRKNKSINA